MNVAQLSTTFLELQRLAPEASLPITDAPSLARVTTFLESLDAEMGEDASHPLRPLADLVMERVLAYEAAHHAVTPPGGAATLAFLMEQRGQTQQELAAASGLSQAVISRLLSGARTFTVRHAKALGGHFRVPPTLFLEPAAND